MRYELNDYEWRVIKPMLTKYVEPVEVGNLEAPGESHMEISDSICALRSPAEFENCAPEALRIPILLRTPKNAPYAIALLEAQNRLDMVADLF